MNTNEQHTALARDLMGLSQKWAKEAGLSVKPEDQCLLACALELSSMLSKHKAALTATPVPDDGIPESCMTIYDLQRKYLRKTYVLLLEPILTALMEYRHTEESRREFQEMLEQLNQRFAEALAKVGREASALPQSAQL